MQVILLAVGVVAVVLGWQWFSSRQPALFPPATPTVPPPIALTPTMPEQLTRADVLPTPTVDPFSIPRTITFPGALVTSRIINASRTIDSWETRYLGDSVGHLQGTSWIGEPGGNVVLAGHVTNDRGEPGPFAYLFEAKIGDEIRVAEGEQTYIYRVRKILRVPPDAIEFVAQDGIPRLTLITCDDWNYDAQQYDSRLVVIAEPAETP
ncbi:MAG: hypothetical protein Kow0077_02020 [Anaerolineae bacterium]